MTWKVWQWIFGNRKIRALSRSGVGRMTLNDSILYQLGIPLFTETGNEQLVFADKMQMKLKITQLQLNLNLADTTNYWMDMFPSYTYQWVVNVGESTNFWNDSVDSFGGVFPLTATFGDTI